MKMFFIFFGAGAALLLSSCSYVKIVDVRHESDATVIYDDNGILRKAYGDTVLLQVVHYEEGKEYPYLKVEKYVSNTFKNVKVEDFRAGKKDDTYSRTLITAIENVGYGPTKKIMVIETIPANFVVEGIGFVYGKQYWGYSLAKNKPDEFRVSSKRSGPNGTTIYEIQILKPLKPNKTISLGFIGYYKVAAGKSK